VRGSRGSGNRRLSRLRRRKSQLVMRVELL